MSERLTLALDGSTSVCTSALLSSGGAGSQGRPQVVMRSAEANARGQARILLRQVDEMMQRLGSEPSDLQKIVVGIGPGTFTGVRIAVATARGLALALGVPVYGVSTLSALAANVIDEASSDQKAGWARVVPVIDARRRQFFYAEYQAGPREADTDGPWVMAHAPAVCDSGRFNEAVAMQGPGAVIVAGEDESLVGELPPGARFVPCAVNAEYLVLGQEGLQGSGEQEGTESVLGDSAIGLAKGAPEMVKPIYVRAPDADIHITKMKDPWAVAGA